MNDSPSLSQLPVRFQKLLSVASLAVIVFFAFVLGLQQLFYSRSGISMPNGADFVGALAVFAVPLVTFIAGAVMVPRGTWWHRGAAGSLAMIGGMVLYGLILQTTSLVPGTYVYAGLASGVLEVITIVLSLLGLLAVVMVPGWWVQRRKLFVTLIAATLAIMIIAQITWGMTRGTNMTGDVLAIGIYGAFFAVAMVVAYRALRGLGRGERVFRAALIGCVVAMVWLIGSFTSMGVAQSVSAHSPSGDMAGTQMLLIYAMIILTGVAYVVAIWFARPVRTNELTAVK